MTGVGQFLEVLKRGSISFHSCCNLCFPKESPVHEKPALGWPKGEKSFGIRSLTGTKSPTGTYPPFISFLMHILS